MHVICHTDSTMSLQFIYKGVAIFTLMLPLWMLFVPSCNSLGISTSSIRWDKASLLWIRWQRKEQSLAYLLPFLIHVLQMFTNVAVHARLIEHWVILINKILVSSKTIKRYESVLIIDRSKITILISRFKEKMTVHIKFSGQNYFVIDSLIFYLQKWPKIDN